MRSRHVALLGLLMAALLLGACAPKQKSKDELFAAVYAESPRSILVLPPMNLSTAAEAIEYYFTTVYEPLAFTGYYVLPYEVTTDILRREGYTDTAEFEHTPLETFRDFFGADAVLFTKIKKWNTSYLVLASNLTVEIECALRSTKTGQELWKYNGVVVVDLSGNNANMGHPLATLLVQAIATAVRTASADYVPYARMVNYQVMAAMPVGPYHPRYLQDQRDMVIDQVPPKTK